MNSLLDFADDLISRYPCVFAGDLYGCNGEVKVEPMSQLADFVRIRKWFTCKFAYFQLPRDIYKLDSDV